VDASGGADRADQPVGAAALEQELPAAVPTLPARSTAVAVNVVRVGVTVRAMVHDAMPEPASVLMHRALGAEPV
jgi:hypothetical protein